jgi:hypothetical protein
MRDSQIRFIGEQGYPAPRSDNGWYNALKFQPKAIGIVVAIGAAWPSPALFTALSVVLWWNTIVPAANPFDAIYNRFVLDAHGQPPLPPAPPPRRFAQGMAATVALVIAAALVRNVMAVAWAGEGAFALAVLSVVRRDFCAGSNLFNALMRARQRAASPLVKAVSSPCDKSA